MTASHTRQICWSWVHQRAWIVLSLSSFESYIYVCWMLIFIRYFSVRYLGHCPLTISPFASHSNIPMGALLVATVVVFWCLHANTSPGHRRPIIQQTRASHSINLLAFLRPFVSTPHGTRLSCWYGSRCKLTNFKNGWHLAALSIVAVWHVYGQ